MKSILFFFFFHLSVSLFSQEYSVFFIPDSLVVNSNVIKRYEKTEILIKSIKSAVIRRKTVFTILNEKGDAFASYYTFADRFSKIEELSGTLYNKLGIKIKSVKKKDFAERAYDDNFSLVTDTRVRTHNFFCKDYPYTVEYVEEETYDGIYVFPSWNPISARHLSVQNSSFSVEAPLDYIIRYKLINNAPIPIEVTKGNIKKLTWEAKNIRSIKYEPFQPDIETISMNVLLAPAEFEYAGYKGKMDSWDNYGKFYFHLYEGRGVLPDKVKNEIHGLINGLNDVKEKIKVLYKYLQENTRYISIQLGIGGLQPFDAKFVAEKKYGDCKALSNYMVSILSEAGINSNIVVINGDADNERNVYEDFPKHYFNHVICCVPIEKDTIWLECTSQTTSAGYLGKFTGNRKGLFVSEKESKLVHTPMYKSSHNNEENKVLVSIAESGLADIKISSKITGVLHESIHDVNHYYTNNDQSKFYNTRFDLPNYQISERNINEEYGIIPSIAERIILSSNTFASKTGKRLFFKPNFINKATIVPSNQNRNYEIVIKNSFSTNDSYAYNIPIGYKPESIPKNVNLSSPFGTYNFKVEYSEGVIHLSRNYVQESGTFSASSYTECYNFYNLVNKTDNSTIVLVKAE